MRALRWAGASLLMLLAGLLGLVGALLCVTLILLPLGIPILFLAKRLFRTAGQLVVPRAVRHPVEESHKRSGKAAKRSGKAAKGAGAAATSAASTAAAKAKSSKNLLPGRRTKTDRVRRKLHLT